MTNAGHNDAVMKKALSLNVDLWKRLFWLTWEPLSTGEKLTWIAFVGQTLAVITLIELLLR